ncbi:MAG: hypothetical protein ACRENH_08870, partial [Gemmatimonadaceae bacterium]
MATSLTYSSLGAGHPASHGARWGLVITCTHMRPQRTFAALGLGLLGAAGCTSARDAQHGPLIVYTAGSLARPIRAALDSFVATANVAVDLESAGSLETARKLTELGKIPDVI